ncbi:hypothetical protein BGZ51_002109 [Haplosporangium sp. Z 767]|nr:hypothetical protein BGZ51_002109 [Haplosporangium sp. Z 767]KAF9187307.1 hypothetical protein BGZ50_002020 [Haplosporangium sp. Z 11]
MALHRPGARPPPPLAPAAAPSLPFFRSSSTLSFTRLLVTFLTLHSLSSSPFAPTSNLVEAIECTYPNYNTKVSPGQKSLLTWTATGSDLVNYESVSATMYCMDLSGPQGGMWRVVETIFQNRGLVLAQNQYQFSVPNCGSNVRDAAVRIIARGKNVVSQDHACQFTMNAAQVVLPPTTVPTQTVNPPTQPSTPPAKTTTTSKGDVPLSTTRTTATASTMPSVATSSTISASSTASVPSVGISPTDYPYPGGGGYYPLPPLPPLTDEESGILPPQPNSSTGGTQPTKFKTIGTILGSICAFVVLIAATLLLVIRRRRTHRRGRSQNSDGRGGMREKLKSKGRALKGANKNGQKEGKFHLMGDDDDDDDDDDSYNGNYNSGMGCDRTGPSLLDTGNGPKEQQLDTEKGEMAGTGSKGSDHDSILSYPPSAYLDPTWRHSATYPYSHSDDEYTMSSMRSSCETSSVVRKYWAASMAARAERRLEGFPPSRGYFDQESVSRDRTHAPSFSSESRKADILSFDESSAAPSRNSAGTGFDIATTTTTREGPFQRHYRNTLSSVNGYIRRSMSMSLASLGSTDNESWHGRHGFRSSINTEFLDHLNIKSVQSEQRQLEYYAHYYRQNPTMSTIEQSVGCTKTMTTGSWRTSSVPSLTSTNDPFKTFDSNEVLVDMGPFSDNHAIIPRRPSASVPSLVDLEELTPPRAPFSRTGATVGAESRSNSSLLRSFPIPPIISSTSSSPMSSLELPLPSYASHNPVQKS